MFATARMLVRELETEGTVLGSITIGSECHLLVIGITPKAALVTLCGKPFAKGLLEYQARDIMPRIIDCLGDATPEDA